MNQSAMNRYHQRFQRVLDYIETHLDANPGLEELSEVALCSKFHFQRQFSNYFGVSVFRYTQWLRMRRAGYRLAFRRDHAMLDIALEAGFNSAEAFSRAFRQSLGQSPSEFRKSPDWTPWHQLMQSIETPGRPVMKNGQHHQDVQIVDFEDTPIAMLVHQGPPAGLNRSIRRFIDWRKTHGPSPSVSRTFNILYNDPEQVPADDYRFGIAASIRGDVEPNEHGVETSRIPAGRCAVLRHHGSDTNLAETVQYLYGEWLPDSGEELRDFPIFFERLNLFPDVPERDMRTDVYLPLR
ncbi:AraC family transcriptional regulator [Saccharospirillum salsuginis]|uniref:AraC family transcriptional regulator n=1 Tax=Saccharospirillum salsuginis TaxID=418750 RepID=A0A918N661_9GAMM|nr:AraC family transcriptional regulator [Saccharospirillum salsuginis]GGX38409.1 AraC family transcriptional regulator [Saccharospirillum salsuginis]